jgi:hypothetical protein
MDEPLVLVRWRDAWFDLDAGTGPWLDEYEVHTTGFLIRNDEHVVSVAQESLPGADWRAVTHIPKAVVQGIIYLQVSQ